MIDKNYILAEIRRTAAVNGGQALGQQRFAKESGIRLSDWYGRHWSKWSDAIVDAGLKPNQKTPAIGESVLLEKFAALAIELGHLPVTAELRMRARADKDFPSHTVWAKLGPMAGIPAKLIQLSLDRPDLHPIPGICARALQLTEPSEVVAENGDQQLSIGYVYLLRFRSDYKVGASADPERRFGEVATQMPQAMTKVHTIKTDDPFGVERYWHKRFESRRLKGEWFKLTITDVRAFKRWKSIF